MHINFEHLSFTFAISYVVITIDVFSIHCGGTHFCMGSSIVNIDLHFFILGVVSHLNLETGLYRETLDFFEIDLHV